MMLCSETESQVCMKLLLSFLLGELSLSLFLSADFSLAYRWNVSAFFTTDFQIFPPRLRHEAEINLAAASFLKHFHKTAVF